MVEGRFRWSWPAESAERAARAREIANALRVPEPLGRALAERGFDASAAAHLGERPLRACTAEVGEPDRIGEAADLLVRAVHDGRLGILCDFDVDGATAQAILVEAVRAIAPQGSPDPAVAVPERNTEGFGPNPRCLDELRRAGSTCLAVLDCGTAAGALLDRFHAESGIVPVVVDHHPPHRQAPPKSGVVVNPWRSPERHPGPQGALCAAALAWFLARAMLRRAGLTAGETLALRRRLTVLGALGTVCDMMRLDLPFNRALIRAGLRHFPVPGALPPGLAALHRKTQRSGAITVDAFGWLIGPRLNAGSRMGSSDLAARCLRERQPRAAAELAERLDACNRERVALGHKARQELAGSPGLTAFADGPVNLHLAEEATPGTAGLVASTLVRRFGWPAVVLARRDDGLLAGSGRSALGFNLGAAVSAALGEGILLAGGGHAAACGVKLSAERLADLRESLRRSFVGHAGQSAEAPQPAHRVDAVLEDHELAPAPLLALAQSQQRLDPWGQGLELPLFGVRGCSVARATRSAKGHLFLTLARNGGRFPAVWWDAPSTWQERLCSGNSNGSVRAASGASPPCDAGLAVAGRIECDDWQGLRSGRLVIEAASAPTV